MVTGYEIIIDDRTIEEFNLLGEFVRQAAVAVLNIPPEKLPIAEFNANLDLPEDHQVVDFTLEPTPLGVAETVNKVSFQLSDIGPNTAVLIEKLGGIEKIVAKMGVDQRKATSILIAATVMDMLTVATIKPVTAGREDYPALRRAVTEIAWANWENKQT